MGAKLHWWDWDNVIDDGIRIFDPDGFRGSDEEYSDLYTLEEFKQRRAKCTVRYDVGFDMNKLINDDNELHLRS